MQTVCFYGSAVKQTVFGITLFYFLTQKEKVMGHVSANQQFLQVAQKQIWLKDQVTKNSTPLISKQEDNSIEAR